MSDDTKNIFTLREFYCIILLKVSYDIIGRRYRMSWICSKEEVMKFLSDMMLIPLSFDGKIQ